MIRLGDLDANIVILGLVDAAHEAANRAEPGTKDFAFYMMVGRILNGLAMSLHKAYQAKVTSDANQD